MVCIICGLVLSCSRFFPGYTSQLRCPGALRGVALDVAVWSPIVLSWTPKRRASDSNFTEITSIQKYSKSKAESGK